MPGLPSSDDWGAASSAYAARAVAYVTRPSAEALISWVHEISHLSGPSTRALDNGAGTGVVTTVLRSRFPNIPILAADLSPGILETIEKKRLSQVTCQVLDAMDLSPTIADDTFSHTLSTFMVQFAADPLRTLKEMYRVTKPGGTLGLCLWGEVCFDAPWEETVRLFEPEYMYPHTWTPDWADEERLRTYIQEAGFRDVRSRTIRPRLGFESPEVYLAFYLESKNPEFMRGYQLWWEKGMEGVMRPIFERVVKENYNGANDFDMEVFLFVAKK